MQMKQWGNAYRTTVVCVESYEARVLRGRLYNPHLPEGETFCSTMDFLLRMEKLLDDMRFPLTFLGGPILRFPSRTDNGTPV